MRGRILLAAALAVGLTSGPAVAADDTITLGSAISLTGKYSINGKHTRNGYNLAVEQINEAGGVQIGDKTYTLEIKYYDDESTPARAAQLAERLINQDDLDFVLGPYSSGLTKAMAPITERYKVPMVEANGAARELFQQGYRYLFAVLSTSDKYLESAVTLLAEVAQKNGKDPSSLTIAGAFENDPFSQDIRAGVKEAAAEYGMEMVVDDNLPPTLDDMTATLTKVKALQPDMLVVSGHARGAILAVRQISQLKVNVPMIALTHCDSGSVIEKFGDAAEYILCASQWDRSLSYSGEVFGTAEEFAQLFEETYGYAPPYQAAESAAGVVVFADAFERAGSLDPQKVRDALAATDMQTFYGPVDFDETGKNTAKPMVLYQIQDGEYRVVAPTRWASSELRYPMPPWSER